MTERIATLLETACLGSGLGAVYRALDVTVEHHGLRDAALVVEVPGLGRQVFHAGRRPLGDDHAHLHDAPVGLHTEPASTDPLVEELLLALGALALRFDARQDPGIITGPASPEPVPGEVLA